MSAVVAQFGPLAMSAFPPLVGAKQTSFGHLGVIQVPGSTISGRRPPAKMLNRVFDGSGASLTPLRVFEPNSMRR